MKWNDSWCCVCFCESTLFISMLWALIQRQTMMMISGRCIHSPFNRIVSFRWIRNGRIEFIFRQRQRWRQFFLFSFQIVRGIAIKWFFPRRNQTAADTPIAADIFAFVVIVFSIIVVIHIILFVLFVRCIAIRIRPFITLQRRTIIAARNLSDREMQREREEIFVIRSV